MKSVFISHSHADKEVVRKLAADLAEQGVRTWVDEWAIKPGDSLVAKIDEGIRTADYILVVLSRDSVRSKWVQKEISAAIQRDPNGAKRTLIPAVIDDVELPAFLQAIKYVDLSTPERYPQGVGQIVAAVLESQGGPPPRDLVNVGDLAKEVAKEVAQILRTNPDGTRRSDAPNPGGGHADPKLVFVITAFTDDMDPIFEGIKAASEAAGLRAERVKDVQGDYRITDKIIEMIHRARFIVADLTHERPNVYFELGYARGLNRNVITTAREGTTLHFDVKDWTCKFYSDSRILERHLKERFMHELGGMNS